MRIKKKSEIKDLFDELSSHYDLLNDLFSLGLHRLWKKKLLSSLRPVDGEKWIDLCCGTGDLTIALSKLISPNGKVIGVDSASEIMLIAKKKASTKGNLPIEWLNKDLFDENMEFEFVDGVVMSYGLRNLEDPFLGLKLIRKCLKPGGRAGILDFNRPAKGSYKAFFQKLYLRKIVIPIASIYGLGEHFTYLEESLKSFPDGNLQEKLAKEAGFLDANFCPIAGGQMGILLLRN